MADKQVFLNSAEEEAYNRSHPDPNRGAVLPFRKDEEGLHWGLPQWMIDAYNAIKLPADVIKKGYEPTSEDIANFALTVGSGGFSASSVIDAPDNALGMFLGVQAKNADKKALAKAMSMESQGASREDIWKDTGWWKKPDGNWAWEIADNKADFTKKARDGFNYDEGALGPTDQLFDHPELYDNYNDFTTKKEYENDPILFDSTSKTILEKDNMIYPGHGQYERPRETPNFSLGERISATSDDLPTLRLIMLHEIQHAIQEREGWTKGSNPDTTSDILSNIYANLPENWHKRNKLYDEQIAQQDLIQNLENRLKENPDAEDYDEIEALIDDAYNRLSENDVEIEALSEGLKDIDAWSQSMIDNYAGSSYQLYRANEGEALASITANRDYLTPKERRERPPWLDFGVLDSVFAGERIPKEKNIWSDPHELVPSRLREEIKRRERNGKS